MRAPFLSLRMSSCAYIVIRRASPWCSAGVVTGISKPFVLSSGDGSSDDSLGFLSSSPRSCGSGSTSNLFRFLFITYLALIGQQGGYRAVARFGTPVARRTTYARVDPSGGTTAFLDAGNGRATNRRA